MSFDVFFVRFHDAQAAPEDPHVLAEIERALRALFKAEGLEATITFRAEKNDLEIDLDGDTAYVHPSVAAFFLHGVSRFHTRLMFEVARVGDMVTIPSGGTQPVVILVDERQAAHLPADLRNDARLAICQTPDQYAAALQHPYAGYRRYADQIRTMTDPARPTDPQ